MEFHFVDNASVNIEPQEVLRLLGYRKTSIIVGEEIQQLLLRQIERGYQLIEPKAVFCILLASLSSEGKITIDGKNELSIGKFARHWEGTEYIVLAICTIGRALESEASRLFNSGDYPTAGILDSVGSAAADSVADYVNSLACQESQRKGLSLTPRISPGYGDFSLQEQETIFSLLPGDKIGVSLSRTYMMKPRKSVSFTAGVGHEIKAKKTHGCSNCNMTQCTFRTEAM